MVPNMWIHPDFLHLLTPYLSHIRREKSQHPHVTAAAGGGSSTTGGSRGKQQHQAAAASSSSKSSSKSSSISKQGSKQARTHASILHQSPIAMYILYTQYIYIYIYLFMYIYHNILKYTLHGSTQIQHFCAKKASGGGCSKWDASMMINSKGLAGCGSPFRKGKLFSTAMALYQLFQCGYCKWGYHTRLTTSADLGP